VQPNQPSPTRVINVDDVDWTKELFVTFRGEPVTGEVVELYPDGRPMEVVTYHGGIPEGLTQRYHPNGRVESELWLEAGIPEGTGRVWYDNGQLRSETRYRRGSVVEERTWAADGTELTDRRRGERA
jgi:antitoxin component YwqK of YwqJK toxin-antitoxin module